MRNYQYQIVVNVEVPASKGKTNAECVEYINTEMGWCKQSFSDMRVIRITGIGMKAYDSAQCSRRPAK